MSLPPNFIDELRQRLSLADVVGKKVMWDNRKSNQAKGDWWAPCPFHQEKTASFHVDDQKGYYYCFGCHQKGDAITFVRETENLSFIEAVRLLAEEAGMPVPEADPKAQEKADRRTQLTEVMEQAVKYYRLQLQTAPAADARAYLEQRGLDRLALERFELGFAPVGWQNLWDHLRGKGVAEDLILAAGLARPSTRGDKPYDTFRNRILFPIRDARGRAIAFGGRALDPDDGAKYLNSPETELFDKGRSLFNLGPARKAAGQGHPLIVAEGYMDVIALARAGFEAAVAPLGTAITEHQLALLWRIGSEPVLALDGDRAGLSAAMRAIDIALPMLAPGKSLRFALLPEGQDPDDLIRAQGPEAMRRLIDGAEPLVRLLWRRETEGKVFDSPERKAALDHALRQAIAKIVDPGVRQHYGQEIKDLRWAFFRGGQKSGGFGKMRLRQTGHAQATPQTRATDLVVGNAETGDRLREAVVLATLIVHPALVDTFADQLESGAIRDPDHQRISDWIVRIGPAEDLRACIETEIGAAALEKLLSPGHVQLSPGIRKPDDVEAARMCVAEELAKLQAHRGAEQEIADALQDIAAVENEGVTWRLRQATDAVQRAQRDLTEDKTEYEVAPNGARVRRDEKDAFASLLSQISQDGPKRAHD
ncbi:MAG: DNA primase [Pseudomonadota bacterium]